MHLIEPFYNWRGYYIASEDPLSPFYEQSYNEFQYTHRIYNYYLHPQWDSMDSATLFLKILYVDYSNGAAVIEFIGEWNDAIENDIMVLKRDVIDQMISKGIDKFILIGENVLNFHYSDDCYYEEWFEDIEDGWVAMVNFHEHVSREFERIRIHQYFAMGGALDTLDWRTLHPNHFIEKVSQLVNNRLQ